jgi:hypothetical protein
MHQLYRAKAVALSALEQGRKRRQKQNRNGTSVKPTVNFFCAKITAGRFSFF